MPRRTTSENRAPSAPTLKRYIARHGRLIGKIANHEKVVAALADLDGRKMRTDTVKDEDGNLMVTLKDRKLIGSPLFTHQRLTDHLSENKIDLIEIGWGATHCSAPFGARPAAAAVEQKSGE